MSRPHRDEAGESLADALLHTLLPVPVAEVSAFASRAAGEGSALVAELRERGASAGMVPDLGRLHGALESAGLGMNRASRAAGEGGGVPDVRPDEVQPPPLI